MDENVSLHSPQVFFNYDEDLVKFNVAFSWEASSIAIRGGRNAFAALAEACAIYSNMSGTSEHDHWKTTGDDVLEMITTLDDQIATEQNTTFAEAGEVSSKQSVSIVYPSGSDAFILVDDTTSPGVVHIVANKDGMALLATTLLDMLLYGDRSGHNVHCNMKNIDLKSARIHFLLDDVMDQNIISG